MTTYPAGMTSKAKLKAVYRLLEEARLAHNEQGAIARSDWKANSKKWNEYSKKFESEYKWLCYEKAVLRTAIRKATFTDKEWEKLTFEEQESLDDTLFSWKEQAKATPTLATSDNLGKIKALSVLSSKELDVPDPYEDFQNDYTEVDAQGELSATTTRATFTALAQDCDSYFYKDKGVDHFNGDFEFLLTIASDFTSGTSNDPYMTLLSLQNDLDDWWYTYSNYDYLSLTSRVYRAGTDWEIGLYEGVAGSKTADFYTGASTSIYYPKFKRDEDVGDDGTLYCYIYDDSGRTNLVDTLTVVLSEKEDFRYLLVAQSWNISAAHTACQTGYVENLDLQEDDPQLVTPGTLALVLTPYAPIIGLKVTPDKLALALTSYAPTIAFTVHLTVTPDKLALTLTPYIPTIAFTAHLTVTPTTLALTLTPYIPAVTIGWVITPDKLGLILTPFVPSVFIFPVPHGYRLEIRETDGALVRILKHPLRIGYTMALNEPYLLRFATPADENNADEITLARELWLRDLRTDTILRKFRLHGRVDTR